jgi:aerobic C4-dicarboxylate transport protein
MSSAPRTSWYRVLYIQVLIGVALGIAIGAVWPKPGVVVFGHTWPAVEAVFKPLGDGFIKLVKMIIAPIIFCTVTHGIASISDVKKLGRVGGKAILYFEVVSTIALILGLIVVNVLQPGHGFAPPDHIDAKALETTKAYAQQAHGLTTVGFLLNIIPTSFFDAFAKGDLLQVLLVSVLTSFAISALGEGRKPVLAAIETGGKIFFGIMGIVVKLAPLGAFGAMAYTVGTYGIGALGNLLKLMFGFYLTAGFFVIVVLGSIARYCGFSIFRFLIYIKEELLLVLGTSSSETALPGMLRKMRLLGCSESTVGLVIPTGYSFNLDGTNIYMTMAAIFLAQATNTPLNLGQQISLLVVAMISSKGASGVTGSGFITLAATLSAVPGIPIESLALILGIDRFMSECRSLTNLIGNGVATVVVSRWEKEITPEQLQKKLREPHSLTEVTPHPVPAVEVA